MGGHYRYRYILKILGFSYIILAMLMMTGLEVEKKYIASIALSSACFALADLSLHMLFQSKIPLERIFNFVVHLLTMTFGVFILVIGPHVPLMKDFSDTHSDVLTIFGFAILLILIGTKEIREK